MSKKKSLLTVDLTCQKRFPFSNREMLSFARNVASEEWEYLVSQGKKFSFKKSVLNIRLVTSKKIQELNREFLGKDRVTDVIAFSYIEGDRVSSPNEKSSPSEIIGDVAVCWEQAKTVCAKYKKTFKEELFLYIIHGVLHVFGYDDQKKRLLKKMEQKQEYYLKKYFTRLRKRHHQEDVDKAG